MSGVSTALGGLLRSTVSSKTPNQVTGLVAWYDMSILTGSNGDPIIFQADSSGTTNDVGGTSTLQTGGNGKNGKNVLLFDGVANTLLASATASTYTSPFTIFIVFQALSSASGPVLMGWNGGQLQVFPINVWDPQNPTDTTGPAADTSWHIAAYQFNGASSKYRVDAGSWTSFSGNPGTGSISKIFLGAGNAVGFLNCKIAEVAVYSNAVNLTVGNDGDQLFNGFDSKWAVY